MMGATDFAGLRAAFRPGDVVTAFGLLTRLPLPVQPRDADVRPRAAAAWAYPLVGLGVGALGLAVAGIADGVGLAAPAIAVLVLCTTVVVTGAMHEDGLADSADGFWGGWDRTRRLEIMKDSHIGTYGVLALILSVLLRWVLIATLIDAETLAAGVLIAAVLSRAAMVWVMYRLPPARDSGLSRGTGKPARVTMAGAMTVGLIASLFAPGLTFIWLIAVAALCATATGILARSKIGGQTGDVLGATQQVVETGVLAAMAAALA